jgi:hypothetical protein
MSVVAQPECVPTRRCDEGTLIEVVERAMHSSASEWPFLRELRVGTGRQNGGDQRLDAFAPNTLPHTAMKRVCYEVKTSREDFLSELKHPIKRRIGMRYSNEFYLYLTDLAADHKPASLERKLTSITKAHHATSLPTPASMQQAVVSETMKGIRRTLGTAQPGKEPLCRPALKSRILGRAASLQHLTGQSSAWQTRPQ